MTIQGGAKTSMNCLVCGHTLAIFRKLSLGDFCCQEHRELFIKDQSERGLARPMESGGEVRKAAAAGTRVYAQFLMEELPALEDGRGYVGYGPVAPFRTFAPAAESPVRSFARLAEAKYTESMEPQRGDTSPI